MRRLLVLAGTFVLLVAACGGDNGDNGDSAQPPPPPPPPATTTGGSLSATTLENPADAGGALAFEKDSLEAPPGEVTLVMENPSSLQHNIAIKGNDIEEEGEVVGEGGESRVTASVQDGEYTFYCSVPGHEEGGMKGTLTVTAG